MIFKNILVPVDFSINTEIAVKKALELVDDSGAVIHLIHVLSTALPLLTVDPYFPARGFADKDGEQEAFDKLMQWKECIADDDRNIHVQVHLVKGNKIQSKIAEMALRLDVGLIIIGKHNAHAWFTFLNTVSSGKLAMMSHCPVLTAKTGSLHNKIKSIVFPVQGHISERKIQLLITLSRRYRARIYLTTNVNVSDSNPRPHFGDFIDTYRTLKQHLNVPIEHVVLAGTSLIKATLHFAESIAADMILVTPGVNTVSSVISGQQVTDLIKGSSKIEVLSVA